MATTTFGTANHPFRATLPLRVLRRLPRYEPEVEARMARTEAESCATKPARPARSRGWRLSAQEVKEFLIAYIACFMAVSAWLS